MLDTTIGKNDSRNTSSSFGVKPKPNQMMNSGAIAIFGNDLQEHDHRIDGVLHEARIRDRERERNADDDREQVAGDDLLRASPRRSPSPAS